MARKIHKCVLGLGFGEVEAELPKDCELFGPNMQKGQIHLFYFMDEAKPKVIRRIGIIQSGAEVPDNAKHLGTVQLEVEAPVPPSVVLPGQNGVKLKGLSYVEIHVFDLGEKTDA